MHSFYVLSSFWIIEDKGLIAFTVGKIQIISIIKIIILKYLNYFYFYIAFIKLESKWAEIVMSRNENENENNEWESK